MTAPDTALLAEIEAFLYLEARLADESRYDEWEALLTEDMHYWVPRGRADHDPATRVAYINDNRQRIATRIRQLNTGSHHAQSPASSIRRLLANVELLGSDTAAGEYRVGANFVLYELALQATKDVRVWPGRATYLLRRVDSELRMAQKTVEFVNASEPQFTFAFLV